MDSDPHTDRVWLALHALHIAMVVLGGVVVCVLLRPRRPGTGRRIAVLRAAGTPEQIRELAFVRARAEVSGPPPAVLMQSTRPAATAARALRARRAAGFAVVGVALGTCAHRLAEGAWPPPWVIALAVAALGAIGYLGFRRARRPWVWAAIVTGSQLLLNAGYSAVAILGVGHGASTADWARVLFCYHAGAKPTTAQVIAARNALGPGAAKLVPTSGGATGLLLWAAIAHFAAAVALGLYVVWGEPLLRRVRLAASGHRHELQRLGEKLDRAQPGTGRRGLVRDHHLVGIGMLGEAQYPVAHGVAGADR